MLLAYNTAMSDFLETDSDGTESLRKILSDNIRAYRKALHLTQERLAESADISLSYLADIEHCKTWISDRTLLRLAKALHRQPFELLLPAAQARESEKPDIHEISDIIHAGKKELMSAVSTICDGTIRKIMSVQ